jgi:hypothetical protein
MQAIGFEEKSSSGRFEAFCEKIGATALISNGNQLRPFIECDNPFQKKRPAVTSTVGAFVASSSVPRRHCKALVF